MDKFTELQKESHDYACEAGFHESRNGINEPMKRIIACALIGTEVSEAIEAARHEDNENYMEELADVVIRVMDEAERVDRLGTQRRTLLDWIEEKQRINRQRPRLHGKVT